MQVSVVIPAFNEQDGIGPVLRELRATLDQAGIPAEILVVDDGSSDRTRALVRDVSATERRVRLVCNETNLGKGGAVARGLTRSCWIACRAAITRARCRSATMGRFGPLFRLTLASEFMPMNSVSPWFRAKVR